MPIRATTDVDIREQIALLALHDAYSIAEIARMFGVSRPAVYKYAKRYREGGRSGLRDRSRAPKQTRATAAAIVEQILADRRRYGFGSKKIRRRLIDRYVDGPWPARSTIDEILRRYDLVKPRRQRPQLKSPFIHRYEATEPGELTRIDFKGEFRLLNQRWCYPLTMSDAVSRMWLVCDALPSTQLNLAWPVVERIFREYGLPKAVLSDNGPPFGGHGVSRLSTFSVRLMELGIQPVFIVPGHPEQNGSHERMHRSLLESPTFRRGRSFQDQQRVFDECRSIYNTERPHEGINMDRPINRYRPSPRPFPAVSPRPEYDAHLDVRSVFSNGAVKCQGHTIFISHALAGRRIGLEPIDDHLYTVHFGAFIIGKIDTIERRFL